MRLLSFRHSRAGGNPGCLSSPRRFWMPACAGMTVVFPAFFAGALSLLIAPANRLTIAQPHAFLPSFPRRWESRLFAIAPAVLDARLRGHDGGFLRIFSLLDTWSERLLDAESIDEMFKKC